MGTAPGLTFLDPESNVQTSAYFGRAGLGDDGLADLVTFACREPPGVPCAGFFLVDGSLVQIGIWPNYPVTYEEVIDSAGQPDYVRIFRVAVEDPNSCDIAVFWRERRMRLFHRNYEDQALCRRSLGEGARIPHGLEVHEVYISQSDDFQGIPVVPWIGFLIED
jgi:hypothetical protein